MKTTFTKRIRNQQGFSMLENLLAATLLAFALLGGMTVMQNATANTVNSDLSTVATEVANEKIELIMGDKVFNGYDYLEAENYPAETGVGLYAMTRTVDVTEVNADDLTTPEEGSGVKKVAVTVSWGTADHQSLTVRTLVSNL